MDRRRATAGDTPSEPKIITYIIKQKNGEEITITADHLVPMSHGSLRAMPRYDFNSFSLGNPIVEWAPGEWLWFRESEEKFVTPTAEGTAPEQSAGDA